MQGLFQNPSFQTGKWIFKRFLFAALTFLAIQASAFSDSSLFQGLSYETLRVRTIDGADLALFRLQGNENGQPVMLSPGVVENAEALDDLAAIFHKAGYRVYIGQVRFAGRGENRSQGARRGPNGFEEAWKYDFPELVRAAYDDSGHRPLHLVGHSMGGILSMILLSQFAEEFNPKVAAITTIGSPYQFAHLPKRTLWLVKKILPTLEFVRDRLNLEKIDWHLKAMDGIQVLKKSTHLKSRNAAIAAEKAIQKMASFILHAIMTDLNHVSDEGMERLLRQEVAALPIQFLIDLAYAALKGEFYSRDGSLELIKPHLIRKPFQVAGGEYDELVPVLELKNLYHALDSEIRRLVIARNMKHVTLVTADHESSFEYYQAIVDFHNRLGRVIGIKVITPQTLEQNFNHPTYVSFPQSYFGCLGLLTRQ